MPYGQQGSDRGDEGSRLPGGEGPPHATTPPIGPYHAGFQLHLIDNNIVLNSHEYLDGRQASVPQNMSDIVEALAKPRVSPSLSQFSATDFENFQREAVLATNEAEVFHKIIPIIEGNGGNRSNTGYDIQFTNLEPLTNGKIIPAKPDLCYGATHTQLNPRVRQELEHHIITSKNAHDPVAPNMFLEVKGPKGMTAVALCQLFYDTALGARGQLSLRSYANGGSGAAAAAADFDGKAYTLGAGYHDGHLKVYATHPTKPSGAGEGVDGRPGYVMTQIRAYAMTSDIETFRRGAAAYRNAVDWAEGQRKEAIKQANERVASQNHEVDVCNLRSLGDDTVSAATHRGDEIMGGMEHDQCMDCQTLLEGSRSPQ